MRRSAGVHRLWQAGRDTTENLGSPMGSCRLERSLSGMQLLRHGRGNPDTGLYWDLSNGKENRREAEDYGQRESPPDAPGVSYQA
jgi:hypothetical protein